MLRINEIIIFVVFALVTINEIAEANTLRRVRRQSDDGNGEVIDNIFNIPITAIRQTAAAAQSIYPEGGSSIDNVFNIPVATLEAVSNLVKSRNTLRRQMDGAETQRRRKDRKNRLQAHRLGQRLQQHKDPLGVNALTDLLVGHHGLFSGHGLWGGHQDLLGDHFGGNLGSQLINHFCTHGSSHGDHGGDDDDDDDDDHDSVGDYPNDSASSSSNSNTGEINSNGYEVTEMIDEDRSGWGGWFDFGNFFGSSSSGSKIQNKVAPRPDRRKYGRYDHDQDAPLQNKVAPKYERTNSRRSQTERPLENKIAPKSNRRYYEDNYSDPPLQDRVAAPRREGRTRDRTSSSDRFVFEHRSL